MPQSLTIAAFVFGAALILIGLTGGNFELFSVKVQGKANAPMRLLSILLGIVFVNPTEATNPPPGPGGPGGPILVDIKAPPNVPPDQWAEIDVMARDNAGQPMPGAMVNLQAGGGLFDGTGNPGIEGPTGPGGHFVVRWKCQACAPAYVIGVLVTKPDFADWKGEVKISIP
jgi:hypothetical protein